MLEIALLLGFFALGFATQRIPLAETLRERTWTAYFWTLVGPAGFFLPGLALPLERPSHDLAELRVSGVLAIRFAVAPLALYGRRRQWQPPPSFV